jgi:hypothetical protein
MKTSYLERWLVVVVLAILVLGSPGITANVFAQTSNTGTVTGVVKDEKGGLVPGASVKLVNLGTNAERSAVTSEDGNYEITQPTTPGSRNSYPSRWRDVLPPPRD